MSRVRSGESNLIELAVGDITTPVLSDNLFAGVFGQGQLLDRLLLEIKINSASGTASTYASLGGLTVKVAKGDFPKIPLRVLYHALPYMGVPVHTATISITGTKITLPFPFSLFKGIHPKDCAYPINVNDTMYLEIYGTLQSGAVYAYYTILPLLISEASDKVNLPSRGRIKYSSAALPAGSDYTSPLDITGASFIILMKSDYADFTADKCRVYIDGNPIPNVNDIRRLNRIYAQLNNNLTQGIAVDTIPDNMILVPLSLDKKMAKISRTSKVVFVFNCAAAYTIQAVYQQIESLDDVESEELIKAQAPNLTVTRDGVNPMPVDATGALNANAKPLFRKAMTNTGKSIPKNAVGDVTNG